jgi:hypothetical protein
LELPRRHAPAEITPVTRDPRFLDVIPEDLSVYLCIKHGFYHFSVSEGLKPGM